MACSFMAVGRPYCFCPCFASICRRRSWAARLTGSSFRASPRFHGCNALKKKINPTRVPIEKKESIRWLENLRQSTALLHDPERCVHIGDRESDIYELFCLAQQLGTHFLVRTCVDRLAGDGAGTIADEMEQVRVQGLHRIQVRDNKGELSEAVD